MFCSIPASMTFVPTIFEKSTGGGPLGGRLDVKNCSASAIVAPLRSGTNSAWCSSPPVFWKCTWFVPAFRPSSAKP